MRTTVDIDVSVLDALRARQRREHKTLGQLVSELLAKALAETEEGGGAEPVTWESGPMRARVDLEDSEAVRRALDETR